MAYIGVVANPVIAEWLADRCIVIPWCVRLRWAMCS